MCVSLEECRIALSLSHNVVFIMINVMESRDLYPIELCHMERPTTSRKPANTETLINHFIGALTGSATSVLTENSQIGGERIIVNRIETPSIIESASGKLKIKNNIK